jgi:uncharacterized membrane protein
MNREQFIAALSETISKVPAGKRQEILSDYEEHFSIGLSEGKTQEEIAQALGDPKMIGKSYLIESFLEPRTPEGRTDASSLVRAILVFISLAFVNLFIFLGPFILVVVLLCAFWSASIGIMIAGIGTMFSHLFGGHSSLMAPTIADRIFTFFFGLGLSSFGLLLITGMIALSRLFIIGVINYLKFNARLMRGEKGGV